MDKSELLHINSYVIRTGEQLDKSVNEIIRNFEHVDLEKNIVIIVYEVRERRPK